MLEMSDLSSIFNLKIAHTLTVYAANFSQSFLGKCFEQTNAKGKVYWLIDTTENSWARWCPPNNITETESNISYHWGGV